MKKLIRAALLVLVAFLTLTSFALAKTNYHVNVDRVSVHVPVKSISIPRGAHARCRDGSYSYSLNRRGTCSHHGGVARWL